MNNDSIKGIKWIPFGLLFIGVILKWMHIDNQGIVLNTGFICFGFVSLLDGVKRKYYKQVNADTIKLLLPLVVILFAADNLVTSSANYASLGITILLYYIIEQRRALVLKKT